MVAFSTAPAARPELRAVVAGLHLEFLNGIRRRKDHVVRAVEEVDVVGVVVDAVEQIVVLRGPLAVGREGAGGRVAARIRLRRLHACAKLRQEGEIAAVERKVIDLLRANHLARRSFLGLQQRRRRSLPRSLSPSPA